MTNILLNQKFLYAYILVFACLLFGFITRRKGLIGKNGIKDIKLLIWDFTLPCMAFSAFMQDFSTTDLKLGVSVFIFSLIFYLLFIVIGKLLFIKAGKNKSTIAALMGAIGQLTMFTMPIVAALGYERATFYCGIMTLSFRLVLYFIAYPIIAAEKSGFSEIKKVLLTPVMIAMLLGFVFWVTQNLAIINDVKILRIDESLPAVYSVIKLLSSMVCPLAMIMIGMTLGETGLKSAYTDPLVWIVSILRTAVFPLIVFLIVSLFSNILDSYARMALVLGFAAPSSVTICTFCVTFNKEEVFSSRIANLTTILSIIFIPVLLTIL